MGRKAYITVYMATSIGLLVVVTICAYLINPYMGLSFGVLSIMAIVFWGKKDLDNVNKEIDNAENQIRAGHLMQLYTHAQKHPQRKAELQELPYIAPDGTKMNAYDGIIYVIRQLGFEIVEENK